MGDGGHEVGPFTVEPLPSAAGPQAQCDAGDLPQRLGPEDPGGDQHLEAARQEPGLLGYAGADRQVGVRLVGVEPGSAVLVLQQEYVAELAADRVGSRGAEHGAADLVDDADEAALVGDDHTVGQRVHRQLGVRPAHAAHPTQRGALTR